MHWLSYKYSEWKLKYIKVEHGVLGAVIAFSEDNGRILQRSVHIDKLAEETQWTSIAPLLRKKSVDWSRRESCRCWGDQIYRGGIGIDCKLVKVV